MIKMKKNTRFLGAAAAVLLLAAGAARAQVPPSPKDDAARVEQFKTSVLAGVESRKKLSQVMNDTVFSFGELGYQEFETGKYLTGVLEQNGFTIQRNVAGMPTGWVARWGSGKPVIAMGSDIDDIPQASQLPGVAYKQPIVEGAPGHGEGHNSGQAVVIVAALAVKEQMEREHRPGTIVIFPGVAEELLGGKAYFVRAGVFKDVDAVLYTHVADAFSTVWGKPSGTGLVSVQYTFHGESAHAAARPWRGRNALRAVELMNIGWDLNREQLRPEQRSHYVITNGGDQPNVIVPQATVWYYFRETDFENIKKNYETGNKIAEAAATMTNTTVTRRLVGTGSPRHFNKTIAQAYQANMERIGVPQWTDEEQTFARAVQRLIHAPEDGLKTKVQPLRDPVPHPESGGTDDIGNVSWVVPTAPMFYPANIPNLPGHNWANAISMATPIAHKGVMAGSKVMALTLSDFMLRPDLVQSAKSYFTDVQMKTDKPQEFLTDADQPAIELNRETMARFRPEMKKFYYDASKYDTYLDQLGVKFPQYTKP